MAFLIEILRSSNNNVINVKNSAIVSAQYVLLLPSHVFE